VSQRRLLLADDSVTIQKVVNLTFADEGVNVVAVGDGDAAMQKFVEAMPDLVMVDVNMPGLDGYRICEMIKQDDETRHIPVILLVGSFEPFDEEEARRVGADDFLTKPFQSIRQLVNKVSDLLNGEKSLAFGDEQETVSDFDDTLEMESSVEKESAVKDFGDAAMDDEMIQTSQIGSLPIDEMPKYESDSSYQPSESKSDLSSLTDDRDLVEIQTETDENESLILPEDFEDYEPENAVKNESGVTDDDEEVLPRHENIYDFANEQEFAEDAIKEETKPETVQGKSANEVAPPPSDEESVDDKVAPPLTDEEFNPDEVQATILPKSATIAGFDEFDLLEVPQSKKHKDDADEKSFNQFVSADETLPTGNLSPEEIDAIADRVVEKLSDKVIKRIVREVFNQISKKK
jgi:CheY-like chemotaxis protein